MKPIIGITTTPATDVQPYGTFHRQTISDHYVDAVAAAGGLPLLLPSRVEDVEQVLALVDGVLATGGADLDPAIYGDDEVHPTTYGVDARRDAFEIALVNGAIERDIPVFGICRGVQVLNVARGGTLVQDVASQLEAEQGTAHRQQEIGVPSHEPSHEVALDPVGAAAEVFDGDRLMVNSFHHQAVGRVADDLVPVATSPTGLVEAVAGSGDRWVLGVQWHPEMMFRHHPEQLRPFTALVRAATARKLAASRV